MKKTLGILFFMMLTTVMVAQQVSVTGRVTSRADGYPVPGVSVVQQGTTIGTITDVDGNYSITTEMGETLVFSFIGMNTREVVVNGATINIEMEETWTDLDEVIVVGYGVQKKSVVTAAISSVSAEDLETSRPSRIEDVLKGKVSGVQITQSSGQPGSDSKVRIRGIGTINNSDPLFIVDGMAVGGGISYLNPSDIESVEVLKDAASAAVYGARAANGVILVTTKSGKSGKTTVNYDFSYGWQNPWKKREVLNAKEYMVIRNEAALNDGVNLPYAQEQILAAGEGTDWQDETFNYDAPVQNHQISIHGGSEQATYFLSFGYYNQEGIIGGNYNRSNYERYSIRSNTTYNVFSEDRLLLNNLKIGVNAGYSRVLSTGIETNSEYGSVLGSALMFNPLVSVYAEDPNAVLNSNPTAVTDSKGRVFSLPPDGFQEIANPVAMLNAPTGNFNNEDKFVASFWAELSILDDLKFKTSYGTDLAFWGGDGYNFEHFLASQGKHVTQSNVFSNMHRGFSWQLENTLNYTKTVNEVHNFAVLLGQSAQKYSARHLYGDDYILLENDPDKAVIDYGTIDPKSERVRGGTGGTEADNRFDFESLASYFGRVDYNYAEKYMFQASVRRDGSSRFGPNNKWAVFPSVSLGWNVTNESFLDGRPDWFSNLKLRGSWGLNGNQSIGNFAYSSLMNGGQTYYYGNADNLNMVYGSSPARIPNADVIWEESEQIDVGFDARFFNSALTLSVDYFEKMTIGMLKEQPIPSYVGKQPPFANSGEMKNSGFEIDLGYRGRVGEFSYGVSANGSFIANELLSLGNAAGEEVLQSAGAGGVGGFVKAKDNEVWPFFYGYRVAGILQNDAEAAAYNSQYGERARPGDVAFMDIAGGEDGGPDNRISEEDKVKIGKGMPDFTLGFNANVEWKNLDLSMFFQGSFGNDIFDLSLRGDIPAANRPAWVLDRWTGEGSSNWIPRVTNNNTNQNWRSSELYIKDGSYVRLKNIQLGYSLPKNILNTVAIERLRLFVSAENLLTITGYDGFDPEIASGGYTTIGVDRGIYPQSRTISFGANISF